MVGVKGSGGPAPKRSDQRRRTNEPRVKPVKAEVAPHVVVPMDPNPDWHKIAFGWFEALKTSPQSQWYTDGDWHAAYAIAESMSREFKPQPLTIGSGEYAHVEMYEMPPKAAALTAWLKGFSALLVCEGDRRRVGIELQMPKPVEGGGDVSWIDDARRHFHSAG